MFISVVQLTTSNYKHQDNIIQKKAIPWETILEQTLHLQVLLQVLTLQLPLLEANPVESRWAVWAQGQQNHRGQLQEESYFYYDGDL